MQTYKYDGKTRFSIAKFDCADTGGMNERHEAIREFTENLEKINEYQQRLFAEQKEGIIFVFQAMDAAGKDGAVRAVLSCLSPQGVSEHSFKVPSAEENRHDYLWRFWSAIPEKGSISIFNRSYYEDVLVQKVHKYYEKNRYADRIDLDTMIEKRYKEICNFEEYLWDNSIRVVKLFLNVSKEEQANRFISRIDTEKKNWKLSPDDIEERAYWDSYMEAYETCINETARKNTPWYVVPADHKWYARLLISRIVLNELKKMDPQWPELGEEEKARLAMYREKLTGEVSPAAPVAEEEENPIMDLKPSDTAVRIARKVDRQALSEKQFRKALKKSLLDSFCQRFGVSEETQNRLSTIYLENEEMEVRARAEDMKALKELRRAEKAALSEKLEGCGKEARKLQARFDRDCRRAIDAFAAEADVDYAAYEGQLKQLIITYENAVISGEAKSETALAAFGEQAFMTFRAHRAEQAEKCATAEARLEEIAARYASMAEAFHPAESEADSPAPAAEVTVEEIG